jgi:hypothetical protein
MGGRQTSPQGWQDPESPSGTTRSRGAGIKRASLITMASLLTALLPVIAVVVLLNVDLSNEMFSTLLFLGIACTIAAVILGSIGRGAAAHGSELRALSTVAVVVGVIEVVGMLAFTAFALALREAASGLFQM